MLLLLFPVELLLLLWFKWELLVLLLGSVCSCGLTDLDGVQNAPSLVTLAAADNSVAALLPVTEMRRVEHLDLEK